MTVSDLSPDALSRLEAKLVADLEMVRKVRALLEEHRGMLGTSGGAGSNVITPGHDQSALSPPAFTPAAPPLKLPSQEEALMECLPEMPDSGFNLGMLRSAMSKKLRNYPDGPLAKNILNKLIRKGQVIVIERLSGRAGSRYRSLIPKPEPLINPEESSINLADLSNNSVSLSNNPAKSSI